MSKARAPEERNVESLLEASKYLIGETQMADTYTQLYMQF